jgi:hypothetical protein
MWFVDLLNSFGDLGKAVVSLIIILILSGSAFFVLSFKLDLISGSFFLLLGAFVVALCSAWLHFQGNKLMAKMFLLGASLTVASIVMQHYLPGTAKGVLLVTSHKDKQVLKAAEAATVNIIRPFECNKTNAATIDYYGENDVKERVVLIKYARERRTNRVLCFRESGVYAQTGKSVQDITDPIIDEIAQQEPPEQPKPATPPVQVAAVAPVQSPVAAPMAIQPVVASTPEPTPAPEEVNARNENDYRDEYNVRDAQWRDRYRMRQYYRRAYRH